jgi:hypothetical protein
MTDAGYPSRDTSAPYEVGYGRPPRRTQFRKGQSGNPGGRPRGLPVQRANALLLQEAYRVVAIKEDGRMVPVSAMQAILRSQVELAINGHFRAQQEVLQAVQSIERSKAYGAYIEVYEADTDDDETDDDETDGYGETDEGSEEDESGGADEICETAEGEATGEGDETRSGGGAILTAVADPAPPVFPAASFHEQPEASPPVPSASPRTASAPRRRSGARADSTPAGGTRADGTRDGGRPEGRKSGSRRSGPAGSRSGGRPRAVTRKRAVGSGPAAQSGQISTQKSRADENAGIPCYFPCSQGIQV